MNKARLSRHMNERECARRNALTNRPAALLLNVGTVGTVLDTLDKGEAFLVEFGSCGHDKCEWLGVLYASELQLMPEVTRVA
jgi:hypothetical protein